MAELLAVENLRAGYDEALILEGVSLTVGEGECVALLGRNGVGKTTLIATLMGLARHRGGEIRWRGAAIAALPAHERARRGLGWVPQERRMWSSLTVAEHLQAVARPGPWTVERALALFPPLRDRTRHRGNELSGGEQQMLAIARALATNPGLLLLDEPMEGLAPRVVQDLAEALRGLAQEGLAMLLVEQRPHLALGIATRALVMQRGRIVHEGTSAALRVDGEALGRWLAPG